MQVLKIGVVAFLACATSAVAQTRSVGNVDIPNLPADKGGDPNKKFCVTQLDTGSRLGGTRTCHTRSEWEQIRQVQRQEGGSHFTGHDLGVCAPPRQC